jgi:ring-1,2-phenylacetyl-CoA epoxidase subunit PaaC
MQQALDHFMPYVQEFWAPSEMEAAAARDGVGVNVTSLREGFDAMVDDALTEANLKRPKAGGFVHTGKHGLHSEHLGFVLAEMQSLARAHPEGVW